MEDRGLSHAFIPQAISLVGERIVLAKGEIRPGERQDQPPTHLAVISTLRTQPRGLAPR